MLHTVAPFIKISLLLGVPSCPVQSYSPFLLQTPPSHPHRPDPRILLLPLHFASVVVVPVVRPALLVVELLPSIGVRPPGCLLFVDRLRIKLVEVLLHELEHILALHDLVAQLLNGLLAPCRAVGKLLDLVGGSHVLRELGEGEVGLEVGKLCLGLLLLEAVEDAPPLERGPEVVGVLLRHLVRVHLAERERRLGARFAALLLGLVELALPRVLALLLAALREADLDLELLEELGVVLIGLGALDDPRLLGVFELDRVELRPRLGLLDDVPRRGARADRTDGLAGGPFLEALLERRAPFGAHCVGGLGVLGHVARGPALGRLDLVGVLLLGRGDERHGLLANGLAELGGEPHGLAVVDGVLRVLGAGRVDLEPALGPDHVLHALVLVVLDRERLQARLVRVFLLEVPRHLGLGLRGLLRILLAPNGSLGLLVLGDDPIDPRLHRHPGRVAVGERLVPCARALEVGGVLVDLAPFLLDELLQARRLDQGAVEHGPRLDIVARREGRVPRDAAARASTLRPAAVFRVIVRVGGVEVDFVHLLFHRHDRAAGPGSRLGCIALLAVLAGLAELELVADMVDAVDEHPEQVVEQRGRCERGLAR
mmetsp:Transcript_26104/g.69473  ORF Transcript_26104/g.69473 Transcript_26104/m.69473 type:complete len:599 (+) Transcript_26104:91-1887(+)